MSEPPNADYFDALAPFPPGALSYAALARTAHGAYRASLSRSGLVLPGEVPWEQLLPEERVAWEAAIRHSCLAQDFPEEAFAHEQAWAGWLPPHAPEEDPS